MACGFEEGFAGFWGAGRCFCDGKRLPAGPNRPGSPPFRALSHAGRKAAFISAAVEKTGADCLRAAVHQLAPGFHHNVTVGELAHQATAVNMLLRQNEPMSLSTFGKDHRWSGRLAPFREIQQAAIALTIQGVVEVLFFVNLAVMDVQEGASKAA